jgi:hypothetical protein
MAANSQNQPASSSANGGSSVSKNTFSGSRLPEGIDARLMVVSSFAKAPSPDEDEPDTDDSSEEDGGYDGGEESQEPSQQAGGAAFNETQKADQLAQEQNRDRNQTQKQSAADTAKMALNPEKAMAEQALKSLKSGDVGAGATQGLSSLLKSSWEFLIESFLTTIIWIDIHAFLNFIGIKQFCKLGYEWTPQEISQIDPDKAKEAGEKLNMVETMGCCCVNGVCGVIVMMLIFQISLLVAMIQDPWGMLEFFGTTIVNLATSLFG